MILMVGDRDVLRRLQSPPKNMTAEMIADSLKMAVSGGAPMTVAGSDAIIPVQGLLSAQRDYWASYSSGGNTLYGDIIGSIKAANADPRVKQITLSVGYSPGGYMEGSFEAYKAVRDSSKPVTAVVRHGALSAAYGLVAQASKIVAFDESTEFGSVGVATSIRVSDQMVELASTDAPEKRPDVTTDEGKAIVRKELDKAHELFATQIAKGRGTDVETINAKYGAGGIVFAKDALKAGMIDNVGGVSVVDNSDNSDTTVKEAAKKPKGVSMDIKQLMAEFPAVYEAVKKIGVEEENQRVMAHLELGEACGDIKIAVEAIKANDSLSPVTQAKYLAAGMRNTALSARHGDNPKLALGDDKEAGDDMGEKVASMVSRRLGADTSDEEWGDDD